MLSDKIDIPKYLNDYGIRPTAVRIIVFRAMYELHDTFSLTDLENTLDSVDKSTLFRTLSLFAQHHLVHKIEDGSGSTKYYLCHNDHVCRVDELHCHFYCESCHKTYCLDHTYIPMVHYPKGFELHSVDYLLKGLCPDCRNKRHD